MINNLLFILLLFLAVCCILNEVIKYLDRRDNDEPAPWSVRLWLVPLFAVLFLLPIVGFAVLFSLFFYSFAEISNLMDFSQYDDLLTFSIFIIIGFLIFESLINPLLIIFISYVFKIKISVYTKSAITIVADSIIIFVVARAFKDVFIDSFMSALSISVFYHIIEWIIIGTSKYLKKGKHKTH